MKPYLAVNDFMRTRMLQLIKQEALFFDQITFTYYEVPFDRSLFSDVSNDLEWLADNNILIEVPPPKEWVEDNADDLKRTRAHIKESLVGLYGREIDSTTSEEIISLLPTRTTEERASFVKSTGLAGSYLTRMISTRLSKSGFEAYPILARELASIEESPKHNVIQIVLNGLPAPDEHTSWEQILEFRSDPDSKSKFLDLRHWMSEMARADPPF